MFFGSCCQMPSVGFIVFVYGVANFLAFVGETTYSLATIAEMPEADHYPEYFRAVVNGIVRVMTMSMCAWWIVSANQARARGMKIAFAWILLRAVGNVMYAYGSVLYETVLMPENLMSFLGIGNTLGSLRHLAERISITRSFLRGLWDPLRQRDETQKSTQ
ncbi:uncharacterized protein LOC119388746 [Rhipicephalus sanguineus]|uniref:uncharacterized protein LOC119388746 n=1 Tax=Rhipicephalus sanguineus TaxID=34632 RepID=UPI0020C3C979|nr:uncharacterized protein LOC119388746 [Rhipicephalus sanguineus]